MLFCGIKFDKKFACLCFKFIKEILGWMSLNLLNFISRFLSKKVLFICLRNFRFCSLSGRILSFSFTMSKLQALWKFLSRNSFAVNFFIVKQTTHRPHHSCNQAKYPRISHGKNFQFYCSNLATPLFAAVSALLVKFILKALKNVVCSPL